MSQSTSSPKVTQGIADCQIPTKYCCFLRNPEGTGCGFIVEFRGVQSANLLGLNWKRRRKIGELQTDYALITSHDTIPGSSPSDLNGWKVSCEGIENGNEQTLSNLICGVISCCGPETLFAGHAPDANVFRSHRGNTGCDIQLNIAILFLNKSFEDLLQASTVSPPVISVNEYLDQKSHTQKYKQIVNTGGKLEVYYCDKIRSVKSTAVSLAEREGISKQSTAAVEQQDASVHEQVLSQEIIEFERLQKLELHSRTGIRHGSPVVYLDSDSNEPSIIGVYVGKTKQDTVVTLHGILRLLEGGLVPVLSALQCLNIPHAWVSRWGYLVTPHINQMKEMENGYICEVLDFLLRKRYGAPLVLLSVDLVEVDNEASLRLLCALFKHFKGADVNEALTKLNLENEYVTQLCKNVINLLKMGADMVTDRTTLVEKCCTFYNMLLNIMQFAGIAEQILSTAENLKLLEKIRQRYKHSDVVQKKTDNSLNCLSVEALKNQRHYEAYQQALKKGIPIKLKYLKMLFFGPPRTGKTSMRRRLVGEIKNLTNEPTNQPSTGTADCYDVIVKLVEDKTTTSLALITKSEWSSVKALVDKDKSTHEMDLDEELRLLYQFIYGVVSPTENKSPASPTNRPELNDSRSPVPNPVIEREAPVGVTLRQSPDTVLSPILVEVGPNASISTPQKVSSVREHGVVIEHRLNVEQMEEIEKAFEAFDKILRTGGREQLEDLLDETILMNMVDTGGHPAFLEMLPALAMGPALYLIFFRLNQELKKTFQIQYVSKDREDIPLGDSSYTVEEVIFQGLSSIACFSFTEPMNASMPNPSYAAMLIGTHKDQLGSNPTTVETKIKAKDVELQEEISAADLFKAVKKFLHYASEDQLMFAVDNMNGDKEELTKVRKQLEQIIKKEFDNFPIPASWLMFSIFLRKMGKRTLSLSQCHEIGKKIEMKVRDTDEALWFLHHHVGTLMHFPDIKEMKDIVICDPQVVFDSVTDLILNSFAFKHVDKLACEKFQRTGQFSLEDIQKIATKLKSDILPPLKLLKLLEHLNIIAPINTEGRPQPDIYQEEVVYFMPAVLKHATEEELLMKQSPTDPVPLMIHFKCGFVPVGVFCAMIASLVAKKDTQLGWTLLESKNGYHLCKNKATFCINGVYDVTLISKPQRYEIYISCISTTGIKLLEKLCPQVLETVCNILDDIVSKMKYKQCPPSSYSDHTLYELGFKCPEHPNSDHLVINRPVSGVKGPSAHVIWLSYLERKSIMVCPFEGKAIDIRNASFSQPSLVWFEKATEISLVSSDIVPARILDEKEIIKILHDAKFADGDWEQLGQQLIDHASLTRIRANHHGNSSFYMSDTISCWLRNDLIRSWEKLAAAVSKVEVYGEATADIVRQRAGIVHTAAEAISWAKKASSLLPLTSVDTHADLEKVEVKHQNLQTEAVEVKDQQVQTETIITQEKVKCMKSYNQRCLESVIKKEMSNDDQPGSSNKVKHQNVQTEAVEIKDQHVQAKAIPKEKTHIRGTEIIAQKTFILTQEEVDLNFEGYGFKLHVPENSLPAEVSETQLNVRVSLSGPFQIPPNSELLSAVYWISSPHKFAKPITVEIQHCAVLSSDEQCSKLTFVHTKCTQKDLPYRFKELVGGVFSAHSSYGSLSLPHFSGLGVVGRQTREPERPPQQSSAHIGAASQTGQEAGEVTEQYCAQLYTHKLVNEWKVIFAVTKDLDSCSTVVKKEYSSHSHQQFSFIFGFESESVSLKIPKEGLQLGKWQITPFYDPIITRQQVNHFSSGKTIPKCELVLGWVENTPPVLLNYQVDLLGAHDHKYFLLRVNPDTSTPRAIETSSPSNGSPPSLHEVEKTTDVTPTMTSTMSDAFRKCSADLFRGIRDPELLVWELYSDDVVSKTVVDEVTIVGLSTVQRKTRLLTAVRDQIVINPTKFQNLLLVLRKQPLLKDVADKLEIIYKNHGPIRGVEVVGMTEFTFSTQGGHFEWDGYGLKLHVPGGSLLGGMGECIVTIRASLSGEFQLPEDTDLLSPVFWIVASRKFTKKVTLEIQHCALIEDERVLADLRFVSANCSQKDLPYIFQQLDGGVFTKHSSYGRIQLSQFSGKAIIGRKRTPRLYCARLYHTIRQIYDWRFCVVITQDLPAFNTVVENHCRKVGAKLDDISLEVQFLNDEITLDFPEGKNKEGWEIIPMSRPVITKTKVDNFMEGQSIPQCQLMMEWERKDEVPTRLVYKVVLNGTRPSNDDFLLLVLDPAEVATSTVQDSASGSKGHPSKLELKDLIGGLNNMADKWMRLGICLGIQKGMLDTIAENCPHNAQNCLAEMLNTWLQQQVDPPPSWVNIVDAVESLGDKQLGKELKKKYGIP